MADESSSIVLQLNVRMRGLVNLTKLNKELVSLKSNALSFQRNLTSGNTALSKTAKEAQAAAKGLSTLAKANRALTAARTGAGQPRLMDSAFASFSMSARAREKQQKQYVKLFDQIERQNTRAAAAEARKRLAIEKAESAAKDRETRARVAKFAAGERQRTAEAQRFARVREAAARREAAIEERTDTRMKSLSGRLREFEERNDAIFRAGFRLQMLGNDMEALGRKTIGALQGMAQEFGDFEFMVNRAAGAVGLLKTETDGGANVYDKFTDQIQSAAAELRLFKPEEVAKATYFWASTTGQQVDTLDDMNSVLRSVNPLMKVAAMTQTDYETAIKGVYSILTQYGLGLSDTAEVTEKLHLVTQRTAAEFPDLVNSFKMVGPVAKEFGVTFDDMVVLLGRLADAGVRGTMSGRAFRQFFIQISRPAPKATAALEALWKSTDKFGKKSYLDTVFPAGKFIGVNKYVDELAKRLQFATDKERMFTLATITTANELPVLSALVSKQIQQLRGLGEGWDSSKENLQEASKGFEQAWSILRDSWNGTVGAFTRGIEILRIKVGGRIAKILTPIVNDLTEKLGDLREWFADPRNEAVIDFFVKVGAVAGGVLAVGGALTVLVGVLISLGAASRVAFGAFKPLFGLFGKAGGLIGVFVVAAIRNIDYLREVLTDAFEVIRKALKDTGGSIEDVSDIFSGFYAIVNPIMDAVIHIFGTLITVMARFTAAVMGSKEAMAILGVAAQALGAIIAARMVIGLGKATVAMLGFGKAASFIRGIIVPLTTAMKALDVAAGVSGGGFKGLIKSLGFLLPALGPAGWLIAGITAAAAALAILYGNNENFRGSVDRMVQEWLTSMDELIAKTDEVYRALGQFGPRARQALNADADYKRMGEEIKQLERAAESFASDNIIDPFERSALQTIQRLKKEQEAYAHDFYQTFADAVDQINERFGTNFTVEEYMARANAEALKLGKTISSTDVYRNTSTYFAQLAEDAKNADKEAAGLVARIEQAQKLPQGGPNAQTSPNAVKAMVAQLADLRATGNLSDSMKTTVDTLLKDGTAAGISAWAEDPTGLPDAGEAEVKKSFKELGNDFIEAAKGTLNVNEMLKEAMKTPTRGQQAAAIIGAYLRGPIAKGFRTAKGTFKPGAALMARDWIESQKEAFQTQLDGYAATGGPTMARSWALKMAESMGASLKTLPKKVTPRMRVELANLFKEMYTAAGKPVPQSVLDKIFGKGKVLASKFNSGVGSPESKDGAKTKANSVANTAATNLVPDPKNDPYDKGAAISKDFRSGFGAWAGPIKTTANTIGENTQKMNKYKRSAKTWGSDLGSNFNSGLASWISDILGTAGDIAQGIWELLHQTTAEKGPLKDTDVWGYHLGENIANGLNRSRSMVEDSALAMANAISGPYNSLQDNILGDSNLNVETAANRTIKVQVEVTSPDGSVDRLKAAELERGIMTNDLILSLEHMATVG